MKKVGLNYWKEKAEKLEQELNNSEVADLKKQIAFLKNRNEELAEKLMKETAMFDFYKETRKDNNVLIGKQNAIIDNKNLLIKQMDYCINRLIESLKGV